MLKNKKLSCLLAAAGLAFGAHAAHAQTAGNYTGTIADGSTMSFTVGNDANNVLAVTSFGFSFTDTCHPGSSTLASGWGLAADAPITAGKATYKDKFAYLNLLVTFTFSGSTATGTIANQAPTFAPYHGAKPTKAVFCSSPTQTFSASIPAPSAPRALHAAGPVLLQTGGAR